MSKLDMLTQNHALFVRSVHQKDMYRCNRICYVTNVNRYSEITSFICSNFTCRRLANAREALRRTV